MYLLFHLRSCFVWLRHCLVRLRRCLVRFGHCLFRSRQCFVRLRHRLVRLCRCLVRLRQCFVRLCQCLVRLRQRLVRLRQCFVRFCQRLVRLCQCLVGFCHSQFGYFGLISQICCIRFLNCRISEKLAYNVPPLLVSCEVRNFYFLLKIKLLAKRERELTTKFAIARNGCYAFALYFSVCFVYFVMSKTSFTLYKFGKFCDLILN